MSGLISNPEPGTYVIHLDAAADLGSHRILLAALLESRHECERLWLALGAVDEVVNQTPNHPIAVSVRDAMFAALEQP